MTQNQSRKKLGARMLRIGILAALITLCWPGLAKAISAAVSGPPVICRAVLMTDCGCDIVSGTCERTYFQCEWYAFWCWGWCGSHHQVEYPGYCGVPFDGAAATE
jgi:hypothetical protein